jgi:hypothetical protein
MYSLPLAPEKKTKRMGININNSQKQQLPTKSSTEIKPTNTTQNRPCSNQRKRQHKILDNIHLLYTSNNKNHQLI